MKRCCATSSSSADARCARSASTSCRSSTRCRSTTSPLACTTSAWGPARTSGSTCTTTPAPWRWTVDLNLGTCTTRARPPASSGTTCACSTGSPPRTRTRPCATSGCSTSSSWRASRPARPTSSTNIWRRCRWAWPGSSTSPDRIRKLIQQARGLRGRRRALVGRRPLRRRGFADPPAPACAPYGTPGLLRRLETRAGAGLPAANNAPPAEA